MYGQRDGLEIEPLQLDKELHVALERIKFPQLATTMTARLFFFFNYALLYSQKGRSFGEAMSPKGQRTGPCFLLSF